MIPVSVKYSKSEVLVFFFFFFFLFCYVTSSEHEHAVTGRIWIENQMLTKRRGLISLELNQR